MPLESFASERARHLAGDTYHPRDTNARHAMVCPVSGGRPRLQPGQGKVVFI
jgi:hypothetical protein